MLPKRYRRRFAGLDNELNFIHGPTATIRVASLAYMFHFIGYKEFDTIVLGGRLQAKTGNQWIL